MKQQNLLKIKPLHYEALKLAEETPTMEDIRKRDVSHLFVVELHKRHEKENIINIQIRGEQTSGKSLCGYAILRYISGNIWKIPCNVQMICPDQIAFLEKVRDISLSNTCLMIDEWNELSTTGYNATTYQALLTHFNEVQAQRHIDKISCSPEKIIDPTARIILEVMDKDIQRKTTRCLCFYVIHKEGMRIEQPLGFVDIDVSQAMIDKTWLVYRKRKFERMTMLMEKGIIDNRKSDESIVILKVVEKLKDMAIVNGIVQRDLIRSYIDIVQDKFTPISIYGEDKLTGTIYGILTLLKTVASINIRIQRLQKVIEKTDPQSTKEASYYKTRLDVEKKSKADILSKFEESIHNHEDIINTIRKFTELDESTIKKGEKEIRRIKQ